MTPSAKGEASVAPRRCHQHKCICYGLNSILNSRKINNIHQSHKEKTSITFVTGVVLMSVIKERVSHISTISHNYIIYIYI